MKTQVLDQLVGTSEISRALGITLEHSRRMIAAGTFGTVYDISTGPGRKSKRVRKDAFDAWLAGRVILKENDL